jgi:hypothetical protein
MDQKDAVEDVQTGIEHKEILQEYFRIREKEGRFFGRGPDSLAPSGERVIDIYPHEGNNKIKTVEDHFRALEESRR